MYENTVGIIIYIYTCIYIYTQCILIQRHRFCGFFKLGQSIAQESGNRPFSSRSQTPERGELPEI